MIKVGLDSCEELGKDITNKYNGDTHDYKKDEMTVIFEKYDYETIAKNLLELGNTLQKTNERMSENIGILKADRE